MGRLYFIHRLCSRVDWVSHSFIGKNICKIADLCAIPNSHYMYLCSMLFLLRHKLFVRAQKECKGSVVYVFDNFPNFTYQIFKPKIWPSPAPPTWIALSTLLHVYGVERLIHMRLDSAGAVRIPLEDINTVLISQIHWINSARFVYYC